MEALGNISTTTSPRVYSRDEHPVSRKLISQEALKVLYRLNGAGFRACLVGGGVRDLLLGRQPKDFDIATDALPEQVRELFRNCRLIGRRFRLAHVRFGREIIEVATFRAPLSEEDCASSQTEDGRILRDNAYGTIDDDAWRRDFSANALYYDIASFSIIDYVGGMEDIRRGVLRLIGDPEIRFREDPVRMLRAIRFAVKLGFSLEPETEAFIQKSSSLLDTIAPARLFDEVLKLLHGGAALETFSALRHYGLLTHLFPLTEQALSEDADGLPAQLVSAALENTDARVQAEKSVTPAFLLAALLWGPAEQERAKLLAEGLSEHEARESAADTIISLQVTRLAVPRRLSQMTREIWGLQGRLLQMTPKRAQKLLEHPRFRAAYDFLMLRAVAGESAVQAAARWWTDLQAAHPEDQSRLIAARRANAEVPGGRRRRRRRRPS